MERDFSTNLPSDITINILSRLSIRSIAISKSVCKPWLNLLESDDFVKSKIKTSSALIHLTLTESNSARCTIFEIKDEDEAALESHDLHYHPLTDLEIPHGNSASMEGITANELLLLYSVSTKDIPLYICNPITREYTELCFFEDCIPDCVLKFGFGVSKISGQYKVVCVSDSGSDSHYVYTLGTGTWRRIEAGAASGFRFWGQPFVCNDNLHWTVLDSSQNIRICGFDVETECFSIFSFPPMGYGFGDLSVLGDCLCFSYILGDDFVIWLMKEYQVEESWTIEYKLSTIGSDFDWDYMRVDPIKLFKDGDILMLLDENGLIYYSNKTRTFQQVGMFKDLDAEDYVHALIFNPSLSSLKNFGFENVISF